MTPEEPDPATEEDDTTEFYVPATFQFTPEPGRVERILVGLFHDRGDLEARVVTPEPTPEFYMPAMYQFSTEPGRIERFLRTLFRERGTQEFRTVPERFVDLFYLPAIDPETYRRQEDPEPAPLKPASEVLPGNGTDPGAPE